MTKLNADTLLAKIDDETPVSGDDFQEQITDLTKVNLCNFAYKGRFEDAADQLWSFVDEIHEVLGEGDAVETALTLLDVAESSGRLDETQMDELNDLRAWIEENGAMYNFKRSLQ